MKRSTAKTRRSSVMVLAVLGWAVGMAMTALAPVQLEAQGSATDACQECNPCFVGIECARAETCAGPFFAKVCVTKVFRYPEAL